MRIRRLSLGNPGDVKPIGSGISEMWIDHGPSYRVYFMQRGSVVVILLCDGDKSTQHRKGTLLPPGLLRPNGGIEDGAPQLLIAALGDIARARNMAALASDAGLSRAGLYKALSGDGDPSFATVMKIAKALGFRLTIQHS